MNIKNREGYRRCSSCKQEKELLETNFCKDKNRLCGISYRCRVCDASKKDYRKNRWNLLTDEQKKIKYEKHKSHKQKNEGRSIALICSYRLNDIKRGHIFDLDKDFLINEIFSKECVYCGDKNRLGCDRLNNSIGHVKSNVVPCCKTCNTTRMNNYSHEEMLLLGKVIKEIKNKRKENPLF